MTTWLLNDLEHKKLIMYEKKKSNIYALQHRNYLKKCFKWCSLTSIHFLVRYINYTLILSIVTEFIFTYASKMRSLMFSCVVGTSLCKQCFSRFPTRKSIKDLNQENMQTNVYVFLFLASVSETFHIKLHMSRGLWTEKLLDW